jgi:hypothetical protein
MRNHAAGFAAAAFLLAMSGCELSHQLTCDDDSACQRGGTQGVCIGRPGSCAFPDQACGGGGFRWDRSAAEGLAGRCVRSAAAGDLPGPVRRNICGVIVEQPPGEPGMACGPCDKGVWRCQGTVLRCVDQRVPIAGQYERVWAETSREGHGPEKAVDGDLTTSWMSGGPAQDLTPELADWNWLGTREECIVKIEIYDNHLHRDAELRTGHGFGSVTVQVLGPREEPIASQVLQMDREKVEARFDAGVSGRLVRLRFGPHQSAQCGGVAEVTIEAARSVP